MTTDEWELVVLLEDALEEAYDMLPYVSEYFQEKWGYRERLDSIRLSLDLAKARLGITITSTVEAV